MNAVILAGGRGERLRPITDTRPKPLVPVLARPVMDYCLSLLSHHGVTRAFVTTHYLADQIRHRYGNRAFGMEVFYSSEDVPLGTAGGVKRIEKELCADTPILVMSGDALCDFDLTRALAFHQEKKADVTIVLSSVRTPLEYGVVLSDTFEKIFAFSEKPDWTETFSDQVNTGVYILEPSVLKKIPEGKPFDFSHDLFPLLLKEGYSLYGYKDDGYWCDIGKIPSLYRCNMDLLQGKVKTYLPPCGKKSAGADGVGDFFVSDGAFVDPDARIFAGSVISPGARVEKGSRVSGSLILEDVKLKQNSISCDCVLCENVTLQEGAMALPGSVLGAESVVQTGAATKKAKKYPPFSVLSSTTPFEEEELIFTERGAAVGRNIGLSGEKAQELGTAFASNFSKPIAVVWDEKVRESAYFASLFASGVVKGGSDAWLLGEGSKEKTSFAASFHRTPGVFVSAKEGRGIFFGFEEDGFSLTRKDTLRLARPIDGKKAQKTGKLISLAGLQSEYVNALCREMGHVEKRRVGIGGDCTDLKEAAIKSGWLAYHETRGKGIGLEVFRKELKLFLNGEKIADTQKARLYLIEKELASGRREFHLPDHLPALFGEHIESRGGTARYFSLNHTCYPKTHSRAQAEKDRWLFDLSFLGAKLLEKCKTLEDNEIEKEFSATPEIYVTRLRYEANDDTKAKLLGKVPVKTEGRGSCVRLRPGHYSIRIISEAMSVEAALENAFECRGKLNEIEQKIGGR